MPKHKKIEYDPSSPFLKVENIVLNLDNISLIRHYMYGDGRTSTGIRFNGTNEIDTLVTGDILSFDDIFEACQARQRYLNERHMQELYRPLMREVKKDFEERK